MFHTGTHRWAWLTPPPARNSLFNKKPRAFLLGTLTNSSIRGAKPAVKRRKAREGLLAGTSSSLSIPPKRPAYPTLAAGQPAFGILMFPVNEHFEVEVR